MAPQDPSEILEAYGADALRLYLVNSPVVHAETLRFKREGVFGVVKDVFLPWCARAPRARSVAPPCLTAHTEPAHVGQAACSCLGAQAHSPTCTLDVQADPSLRFKGPCTILQPHSALHGMHAAGFRACHP